jgi:tetratricopeptide (TPR) repeat protein
MKTEEAVERELFEDYLLGRLGGTEREEFERLYFEDEECFARLQAFLDAHAELTAVPAAGARRRPRSLPVWALSAAAALGVAGVGWAVLQRAPPPTTTGVPTPTPEPVATATPPAGPLLGETVPPSYAPLALRGVSASERDFREAMEPYQAGSWAEAIARLEPLARRTPEDAALRFFLGACYLLTERYAEGAAELEAVVRLGPSPYLEEALVYRARALAGAGDLAGARGELEAAAALGGDLEPLARELLARLDQHSPRP